MIRNKQKETKEDRWCDLPTLVLWRIKDRLDFPDNLRFASVCKSWQKASSSYTKTKIHIHNPPWIMITRGIYMSKREFISTSTGNKYSIPLVDFCSAKVLFSKQGWLLLEDSSTSKSSCYLNFGPSVCLLYPFAKTKIELPSSGANKPAIAHTEFVCGAFTVADGMPDLVVIVTTLSSEDHDFCHLLNVRTIHLKDNKWTMHSYKRLPPHSFPVISHVLIVRQLVYCFNEHHGTIVLNLSNLRWTDLMQHVDNVPSKYLKSYSVMESEGEIYKCVKESDRCGPVFYKLNANCWAWEPLQEEDLKDKYCWFVSCPGYTSFVLKQNWSDEVCRRLEGNGYNSAVKVHLHDAKMMVRKFQSDLTEDESAEWVDMG
ncbi:hypothetical protein LguiA_009606 [Lonicera macranthoides]